MNIKKIRPADESKTIVAIKSSDRIQVAMIAVGALTAGLWVIVPADIQADIQGKAAPILSAMLVGAGLAGRVYNSMAKDGRIDVGDLFTAAGHFGPDKGEIAAHVLLQGAEKDRFEEVRGFVEHGIRAIPQPNDFTKEGPRSDLLIHSDGIKTTVHNPDEVI